MTVDGREGVVEALLAFAIELRNGAAQLGYRLLDIGALGLHGGDLLHHDIQFVVGLQVDATEPLALGLEALMLAVCVGEVGRATPSASPESRGSPRAGRSEFVDATGFVLASIACVFEAVSARTRCSRALQPSLGVAELGGREAKERGRLRRRRRRRADGRCRHR